MGNRTPAEVFAPGEFINEELEARGWSQVELAEVMDRPARLISELVAGKRAITPETAKGLGAAFGTGPQFWMNLERDFRLAHAVHDDAGVERRSKLYAKAPVKEMVNRRWIEPSDNIDVLEKRVLDFLEIANIDTEPALAHAAKKGSAYYEVTTPQWAWVFRVIQIAKGISVPPYSVAALTDGLHRLEALLVAPEEVRHVPRILSECGVRLVFVEKLQQAKIDGVCCWLDKRSPVIGMSLRRDRIDNFWFVLRHEIEHVLKGDGKEDAIVDDLEGERAGDSETLPPEERVANIAAANFCVPTDKLRSFMARKHPFYYEKDVIAFAHTMGRHPGLAIGQLQFRLNDYKYLAKRLALYKVRQFVLPGAIADGWGQTIQSTN
ncbi:MAG TPA: HigA family addiction module antitoxin [Bryobacteraceae bacterium]|jgi:HTH-type transcriptional regulator/antitoxin HigA|nr:HigA family addiction module antitoxin [Bryobacteraceae bacterium]